MPYVWHRKLEQPSTHDLNRVHPSRRPLSYVTSTSNPATSPFVDTSDDEFIYKAQAKRQMSSRSELTSGQSRFSVVDLPGPEFETSNYLLVVPSDFPATNYVLVNDQFPLTVQHDQTGKLAPGQVGVSVVQQQWMSLSISASDTVTVSPLELPSRGLRLASLNLEIDFQQHGLDSSESFSTDEMAKRFIRSFEGRIFGRDQNLVFEFHGQTFKATVRNLSILGPDDNQQMPSMADVQLGMGILTENTKVAFVKAVHSRIKMEAAKSPNAIFAPNFRFEDLGIGGLNTEFATIFRRAFASRLISTELVGQLGIQHVRGIILFGPPGTGKTLMARRIGKLLDAHEPKVVNGPEILNKFIGGSENNVRELFVDAEKELKEKGAKSGLHIIIFDEIDAICKRRGGDARSGNRVGDGIVNQLLSKMDGVEQINNILLIGMTNRFDMLDEALLRPGRFEVHIGLPLPNKKGREQILTIHTLTMKKNGVLSSDVDLAVLAARTNNFSGADINGLVKNAMSYAFNRHVKPGTVADPSHDLEDIRVDMQDFTQSIDEVRPAQDTSLQELKRAVSHGIIHFNDNIRTLLYNASLFSQQVRASLRRVSAKHRIQMPETHFSVVPTPLVPILLHGPPGAGKTALAATIARESQFPYVRIITPEGMVGLDEAQQVAAILRVFDDSHKSPLSVIIIDNIERLLGWIPIGPKYSNAVLQALLVLLQRRPPKGHGLLVIVTTSTRTVLADLQMMDLFDAEFNVHPISTMDSLGYILRDIKLFSNNDEWQHAMDMIERGVFGQDKHGVLVESPQMGFPAGKPQIGIKKLLRIVAWARQEPGKITERLVEALVGDMVISKGTTTYLQTSLLLE